jgi:hypothetical protein
MITLPKIIDAIAALLIKRSERKPDDVAPEVKARFGRYENAPEADQSMMQKHYPADRKPEVKPERLREK